MVNPSIKELKALSNEELERLHDEAAQSTMVGTKFYLEELGRRDQDKLNQEMLRLTHEMHRMTITMTSATILALIIAVASFVASVVAVVL
jgi:RNA processing factor Prp31